MNAIAESPKVYVKPQEGPQTAFLSTTADIAIYGGAAGGGKSFALLLEPLRHFNNAKFGAVIFRRNSTQVRNEGGLWHESVSIYSPLSAYPREAFLEWVFPSGARVKFGHLEHERSVYDWHGSQIALIGFDELTHFSEKQFWYMLSRNRSTSGVPGYVRASCNPDADSWVRTLVDWWINDEGYPIPERSGVIRWFVRMEDEIIWGDSRQELVDRYGADVLPKSFTFIPSSIYDNKILLDKDPSYLSSLKALSRIERLRLLGGNWNVRATAGMVFQREWFPIVDAIPSGWISSIRFWDRAATKPNEANKDPDWTRGLKLLRYPDGSFLVTDLKSIRDTPGQVENLVRNVASHDTRNVKIMSQQDPGSAGVAEAEHFVRMLAGYNVRVMTTSKDKLTRAKPVSAQAEVGNIRVLRAPWNNEFFTELENFPDGRHDDIVDVLSGAFNDLCGGLSIMDAL
jgi:predicted phage terminase large subunit-like protein